MGKLINSDFVPIDVAKSKRCFTNDCKNKPKDMQFYLTEWTIIGGASIDTGVIYCEECVVKASR